MRLSGAVPHSGNACYCWQCVEEQAKAKLRELQSAEDKAQKKMTAHEKALFALQQRGPRLKPLTAEELGVAVGIPPSTSNITYDGLRSGVLGGVPAQRPGDHDKTTITRTMLEELCRRARLGMDWNGGNPILRDGAGPGRHINGSPAAASEYDAAVRKLVDETLRTEGEKKEEKALKVLKAQGATDDDITAAEALLGWKPPKEEGKALKFATYNDLSIEPDQVQTVFQSEMLKRYLEKLDAQLVSSMSVVEAICGKV